MNKKTGFALAAAAAALFSTAMIPAAHAADMSSMVKCMGVNSCKGQSQCKTASNACAGQNSCKGKGWIPVASKQVCMDQGGSVIE